MCCGSCSICYATRLSLSAKGSAIRRLNSTICTPASLDSRPRVPSMAGGQMTAQGIPGEVREQKARMHHQPNRIIHKLELAESLVSTLMPHDPQPEAHGSLRAMQDLLNCWIPLMARAHQHFRSGQCNPRISCTWLPCLELPSPPVSAVKHAAKRSAIASYLRLVNTKGWIM